MTGKIIRFPKQSLNVQPSGVPAELGIDAAVLDHFADSLMTIDDALFSLHEMLSSHSEAVEAQRHQNAEVLRAIERGDVAEMERLYEFLAHAKRS